CPHGAGLGGWAAAGAICLSHATAASRVAKSAVLFHVGVCRLPETTGAADKADPFFAIRAAREHDVAVSIAPGPGQHCCLHISERGGGLGRNGWGFGRSIEFTCRDCLRTVVVEIMEHDKVVVTPSLFLSRATAGGDVPETPIIGNNGLSREADIDNERLIGPTNGRSGHFGDVRCLHNYLLSFNEEGREGRLGCYLFVLPTSPSVGKPLAAERKLGVSAGIAHWKINRPRIQLAHQEAVRMAGDYLRAGLWELHRVGHRFLHFNREEYMHVSYS